MDALLPGPLHTLGRVRAAGIAVCCGGIIDMGESRVDGIQLLLTLPNLLTPPQSVPIKVLVPILGTVLGDWLLDHPHEQLDDFDFVPTTAVARILTPKSVIRLSADREFLGESSQAYYFLANSIFNGDTLLTTSNCGSPADAALFEACVKVAPARIEELAQ